MTQIERTETRLEQYYKAEEAILSGQEYQIGSRKLRRAELKTVQEEIKSLRKELSYLKNAGKNKVLRGLPLDV